MRRWCTDDFARFAEQQVIASMEPPHAVEDKPWAADRLGADRVKGPTPGARSGRPASG
jgi:predicted amidohydrolase YtcJ